MKEVGRKVDLASLTTLRVGGTARDFAAIKEAQELPDIFRRAAREDLPVYILGGGSNLLVSDTGVDGLVLKIEIKGIEVSELQGNQVRVSVGAGEDFDELIEETVKKGWWGLENLSGIPGTVGATPVQNVGAYGVEVSDLIYSVMVFDPKTNLFLEIFNDDCHFSYRDSIFKSQEGERYVITKVSFILSKEPNAKIEYKDLAERFGERKSYPNLFDIRSAILDIRSRKFPDWKKVGTAGSFFKNPLVSKEQAAKLQSLWPDIPMFPQSEDKVKVSLGYILDKVCGLRGHREGSVGLFDKQALVLVNFGGATASDVIAFEKFVSDEVMKKTGLQIEREVNAWM